MCPVFCLIRLGKFAVASPSRSADICDPVFEAMEVDFDAPLPPCARVWASSASRAAIRFSNLFVWEMDGALNADCQSMR